MAQIFFINQNSTLPYLRMDVINDGRYDFQKIHIALQAADVKFTMINDDTGVKKIAKAQAYVVPTNLDSCDEQYSIEYRWTARDTKDKGNFTGQFHIIFKDEVKVDDIVFPKGELIVPIAEELKIKIL